MAANGSMPIRSNERVQPLGVVHDLVEVVRQRFHGHALAAFNVDGKRSDVHAQLAAGAVQLGHVLRGHGDLGDFDGVVADRTDLAERFERSNVSKAVLQHHGLDAYCGHCFPPGFPGPSGPWMCDADAALFRPRHLPVLSGCAGWPAGGAGPPGVVPAGPDRARARPAADAGCRGVRGRG